jgi:hypothetical protein
MKAKRPEPGHGSDERRRGSRQQGGGVARCSGEAQPRKRRPRGSNGSAPAREQRPRRSAPQTSPIPRPSARPAPAKNASQAKARAKARKAKAPKVVRPPLRERLIVRLMSIDLRPRTLAAKVPFVVLIIGSLGLGLGVTLWLSTASAERSYELGNARQTNQALLQQKEALERNVLEAQAAPALAEAARNLGMIPSRDTAHLVQDPAGNWIVVGTPKPAAGVPPPPLNTRLPDETPAPPPAPARPAPPVDPREVVVRVPPRGAATPPAGPEAPAPTPQAAPLAAAPAPETPHGAAGQPPALGPAPELSPTDPAAVPPDAGPPHLGSPQGPTPPSAPVTGEQFTPVAP